MKHKPTIRLEKDSSCISIKTISVFYITKSKGNKNPDTETTQKEKAEKERKKKSGPCSGGGHQCWDQCPSHQYREL